MGSPSLLFLIFALGLRGRPGLRGGGRPGLRGGGRLLVRLSLPLIAR